MVAVDAKPPLPTTACVELPIHLYWGPARVFDLRDPGQRRRLYEIVLREGRSEDIRRYLDPEHLATMWDELVLPANVRDAWADYFERRRGLRLRRAQGRSPVIGETVAVSGRP